MKTQNGSSKKPLFNPNPPWFHVLLFGCMLCMVFLWCPQALSEPRCTGATTPGFDELNIWNRHQCNSDWKSWATSYFRLKESDWDQGWGWRECDHTTPFGKMLNSAFLLVYGLESWENYPQEDYLLSLRSWTAENATKKVQTIDANFPISADPSFYEPVVLNRPADDLHIIGINTNGDLMYYRGGQRHGDWVSMNITYDNIAVNQRVDYRLINHPVHVSDGIFDYFFGVTAARDVVLYQRSVTGGPWGFNKLTKNNPERIKYRAFRRLVAVYSGTKAYAFGINNQGHLISYGQDADVIDITNQVFNGDSMYRVRSHLLGASHSYKIHVYGLSANRQLIHYYQSQTGSWAAEEIIYGDGTQRLSYLSSPVLIKNADGSDQILGVSDGGNLFLYTRNSSGVWSIIDMTSNVLPSGGDKLDPRYQLTAYKDANNILRVLGVNYNSEVLQYSLEAGNCYVENITNRPNIGPQFRASVGGPVVVGGANNSQHVYLRGEYGSLYHYYRSPSHPWSADDITSRTNIGYDYIFVSAPIIASRVDYSHHVIVFNKDSQFIHYYTSTQAHPWHSNADYAWLTAGDVHDFHYEPEDEWSDIASAEDGFWQRDKVKMHCPVFDGNVIEGGPGGRAGAMVHEAPHIIYYRWKHETHPLYGGDADRWLYHGVNDYPPGSLNVDRKHSMYQIQVEYLSDLAEFPARWVPLSVCISALGMANSYIYSIINPPAWVPGEPRPL